MSIISKVKQNIRDYLTTKYDAMYFQELDSQVTSYDDWIWEQNNSKEDVTEELILDLGKEKKEKQQKRNLVTKLSYGQLASLDDIEQFSNGLQEKQWLQALLKQVKEISRGKGSEQEAGNKLVVKKGTLITKIWEDREIVILAEDADRVTPDAVDKIVQVFCEHPEVEVLYTDEDEVNHEETVRMNPWFKPDYSPDTLLSYFYFGSLVAMSQQAFERAFKNCLLENRLVIAKGYKITECNDLNDDVKQEAAIAQKKIYALTLEACATLQRDQVYHLKKVLYSSHNITYWGYEEEYREIREHYDNLRKREEAKGVSIVIPSKDNPLVLERCLQSVKKWTKDLAYEIIVVDNGSNDENKQKLETIQENIGFTYLYEPMEFNFSKMCNMGAAAAKYELLLFLNDDCEVRGSKWLSHMASRATVEATGVVGAKLYYPESKCMQHCGIYNIHVGPVHKLQFKEDIRAYYDRRNLDVRNVLAVTAACLMVRKSVFEKIKGFDESLQVAFNDVDFCYKLYEAGYNNVVDNTIHLWHHESLSRGSDESPAKLNRLMQEKKKLYQKHRKLWEEDPYYHPGFSTDILDTSYSFDYEYPHHMHLAVEHPTVLQGLPKGCREDQCVAPMVEYAGDLEGWFLEDELIDKICGIMKTKNAAYLQGNVVVLGSDNACFEKKLVLRHEESGTIYEITPEWFYRPDVFANLQDQVNVALSGFACLVNMDAMPKGRYELGILVTDKISKQSLLRVTTRSIKRV